MNIKDYGFDYEINSNETIGTPARITAVHKGRFAIVSDFGDGYAQLKGKEYYYGNEVFRLRRWLRAVEGKGILLRERGFPNGGRFCADRSQQQRRQPHHQNV